MSRRSFFTLAIAVALSTFVAVSIGRVMAQSSTTGPAVGWTIHIDAKKHFGNAHPNEIAHHWCKPVENMLECQIYDSDAPNAHLVAVETVVQPAMYQSFSTTEKAMWHYHRDEIPKVDAVTPDLTPEESKKLVAGMLDTYGKVWVLWDPMTNAQPTGNPWVSILN